MKLLAVTVLYHPDLREVADNIMRYARDVEALMVWDNSPADSSAALKAMLPEIANKLIFRHSPDNEGIPTALNHAGQYALAHGFTHLLTMDQDSSWENFAYYRHEVERLDDGNTIFGPRTLLKGLPAGEIAEFHSPDILITSGTLYPLDIFRLTGGYTTLFSIDGIDWDFCLRAREKGVRILSVNRALMRQEMGQPEIRRFLWKKYRPQHYPPFRLEEILKSHIYLIRRYRLPFSTRKRLIKELLWRTPRNIILFEDDKKAKLRAIGSGLRQGLRLPVV